MTLALQSFEACNGRKLPFVAMVNHESRTISKAKKVAKRDRADSPTSKCSAQFYGISTYQLSFVSRLRMTPNFVFKPMAEGMVLSRIH